MMGAVIQHHMLHQSVLTAQSDTRTKRYCVKSCFLDVPNKINRYMYEQENKALMRFQ